MAYLLPTDELNVLGKHLSEWSEKGKLKKEYAKECCDELLDLLLMAYVLGSDSANSDMGTEVQPTAEEAAEAVNTPVAGKTYEQRVTEYFENEGTADDIIRIADTETHRVFSTGADNTARKAGAKKKTWVTMADDKVRDEHWILDGVKIPIDDWFYVGPDAAQKPGGFESPELNINCRCWLTYSAE